MGHGHSTPLAKCLDSICSDRKDCVAYPDNPLYKVKWATPSNLNVPVTPAAVIRPDNAKDVAQAVVCAQKNEIRVQSRSGGHSYANFGMGGTDGELMIDLVNLKNFSMDTDTWQATLGSGFRLGELDQQLHDNGGRAIAHGTCPDVGIGGHATVGGLGPMSRMWGNSLDHVIEVEVVTADGEIRRASETENSDLFWALRGAGASFGIITEFVVKTHQEPDDVVEYTYSFSFGSQSQMKSVYKDWQDLIADPDLDRRFSSLFVANPLGAVITTTFYGTEKEYHETGIMNNIPSGGVFNVTIADWMGHLVHQAESVVGTGGGLPSSFYSKSLAFKREDLLNETSISTLFDYVDDATKGTLIWYIIWNTEGGAVADFPVNSTSYPHRDKIMMYQSYGVGIPDINKETEDFLEGIHEHIQEGAPNAKSTYAGYVDPYIDSQDAQQLYWAGQLPRLRKIKAKWDSEDLFHNPQSVWPETDDDEV